ncbi:hypothetical protein QBC35DRAFT_509213 [Podospora australis]|uniref:SRR1-like domain-containing protein n=1 Tax=Podospora australis TaxID=1536484 RepID=A0AAN7AEC0_9PEZI|nr:hypothetical protein QBC35DRAFT_509213 [Podospora australis]
MYLNRALLLAQPRNRKMHHRGLFPPPRIMQEVTEEEAVRKVRQLYDSGVPFFTKDALRHMASLLQTTRQSGNNDNDQKLTIMGLDGHTTEITCDHGKIMPNQGPFGRREDNIGYEAVWNSCITYTTINQLLWPDNITSGVHGDDMPYFPMSISYRLKYRHSQTKAEVIVTEVMEDSPMFVRMPLLHARQAFEHQRLQFRNSPQAAEVRSVLDSYAEFPTVKKIVAFACGSLLWDAEALGGATHSLPQHALALFVRDYFSEKQGGAVQCFAQEPDYQDADCEILEEVGVTVLEDPWGFIEVDDETVVLAFSPDVPVRQIVADLARPGLMFWNSGWHADAHDTKGCDPGKVIVSSNSTDPMAPRLGKMVEGYWEHPFREEDGSYTFFKAAMYIRKPIDVIEAEEENMEAGLLAPTSE